MGETDFTRTTLASSSDDAYTARGMMHLAEWSREYERMVFPEESGDRIYLRHIHDFREIHIRKYRRKGFGKHGFSRAWRSFHEDIVSARGRYRQGSFGMFLSDDMLESCDFHARFIFLDEDLGVDRCVLGERSRTRQYIHERRQVFYADQMYSWYERSFLEVFLREKHVFDALFFGEYHGWEDSVHASEFAIECELSDKETLLQILFYEIMLFAEYTDRYREIEARSFFAYICGREIDRDTRRGKYESGVLERTSHALFALLDGSVGESDYIECGHAVADIELDIYLVSGEPVYGYGKYFREHKRYENNKMSPWTIWNIRTKKKKKYRKIMKG